MKSYLLALGLVMSACDSHAVGHLAQVEILNRETGQVLPVYRARGEYWVAGSPGARYAVVIHNQAGERVLAVTTVDGVNVISGETGAYEQSGYVFDPGQQYAIDGWRKSNQEIAAFNFTTLPDSYAVRTGREANVGVIGVALFLERPQPPPPPMQYAPSDAAPAPATPQGATRLPSEPSELAARSANVAARQESRDASVLDKAARLGTGHGEREYSYVSNTEFLRRTSTPSEVIRIRYDRYDNLVAMGVVKARPVPAVPNPFPESGPDRFVPDPPGL